MANCIEVAANRHDNVWSDNVISRLRISNEEKSRTIKILNRARADYSKP